MDWDERAEASRYSESLSWARAFNTVRGPRLAAWVSTFRDNQPSEIVADYLGSAVSLNGRVMHGDEKVRHEVAVMKFIKEKTSIPIPSIIAWGSSSDNPLGLGSFIIMEFIEGEPLDRILRQGTGPQERILGSDISDRQLETIYRQIANILLELSAHDFLEIGSLGLPCRPLTPKINEIESHGGVRVEPISKSFSSATEYFHDIAEQDMQHLRQQPNSIDDAIDARRKYLHSNIFKSMIPHFVSRQHDHGPFKLICDDFRYGNILVNNADDLRIAAVLDWEWAYVAPYQLQYSPPRWLLIKEPYDWEEDDLTQYKALLKIFTKVLEEEEQQRSRSNYMPTMAALMQQSMEDGKFWFHELVYSCFESPDTRAWTAIRELLPDADQLVSRSSAEVNAFVEANMEQLDQYNAEWASIKREIDRKEAEFQALKEKVEKEDAIIESEQANNVDN